MDFFPSVVQVLAGESHTVYAYCNDGAVRLVDVGPLIEKGGVFSAIADRRAFRDLLTVMNGTVAWDTSGTRNPSDCIDLDPFWIFEDCPVVEDPLKEVS